MTAPRDAVEDAGGTVVLIATTDADVTTLVHDNEPGATLSVDTTLDSAQVGDYDALIIPGGTINADTLRTNEKAVDFVRAFVEQAKPIASICHRPWMLVEADVIRGTTLTSYPSIQTDVRNAGGTWVDEPVHISRNSQTG